MPCHFRGRTNIGVSHAFPHIDSVCQALACTKLKLPDGSVCALQAAASEQLISRLAEELAAQAQAKRELQVMSSRCKSLQQQLAAQVTALDDLRATSAQQAADVAAAAAARLENGLAEQRSQLQAEFYAQSLQAQAAADDALQQALDSAADHRQVLLAQADSERCCMRSHAPRDGIHF